MGMKKGIKKYADIAMLSVIGLVPLLWFRDGYNALAGFDFSVYLSPVDTLKKSFYLWSDLMAGGYDISHEVSSIPYYLFFSLPMLAGASLYTAEKIVFVALFALQGFSMYYMLGVLFEKRKERRMIALSGAVFYSFSYPVMAHFGRGNLMTLLCYGLLPVLLGLLYRGFNDEKKSWRCVILIALLSFPIAAVKGHPADFMVLAGVAVFFTLFHVIASGRGKMRHMTLFGIKTAVASVIVSVWWIVPNVMYMRDFGLSRGDLVKEGFYDLGTLAYYSRGTSILNSLRNERLDLWFNNPGDFVLNAGIYQTPFFIAVGIFLPVLAYMAAVVSRRDRNIAFFALLGVISVFFSKGSHEPYGGAYEWLYMNLPGFFLFRAPYRIFSSLYTFSIVPLMAYTVGILTGRMSRDGDKKIIAKRPSTGPSCMSLGVSSLINITIALTAALVFFSSCAYAWPLFTGAHLKDRGTLREPGVFHNIPDGYAEARAWLDAQGSSFKVYYPYEVYDANTDWGYNGPDPSFELLLAPKVAARPNGTVYLRYQKPIESLNKTIRDWSYGDLSKVIGVYNARYVLVHDDFNRWIMPSDDFNEYMTTLLAASGFQAKKIAGPLRFFENKGYLPRVRAAAKAYLLSGDEASFPALSLAGFLDDPFLVMAKDAGGIDAAERLIARPGAAQGIIYYNTNVNDLVCELSKGEFRPSFNGKTLSINAPVAGAYDVFSTYADAKGFFADGRPADSNEAAQGESGIKWRKTGEVVLAAGIHALAVELKDKKNPVDNAVLNDIAANTVVIPKGLYSAARNKILGRMKDKGFEVVYFLDGAMQDKGAINLAGDEGYRVMMTAPMRYSRVKVEAPPGNWEAQGGNMRLDKDDLTVALDGGAPAKENLRLIRRFTATGLARYKDLAVGRGAYPAGYLAEKVTVSVYVTADGRVFNKDPIVITDKEIGGNRTSIDLLEAARAKYGEAAVYMLGKIEVSIELEKKRAQKPERYAYKFAAPVLTGTGLYSSGGCEEARNVSFRFFDKSFFVDPKYLCDGWAEVASALGPGDAVASFDGAEAMRKGPLVAVTKYGIAREGPKAAALGYERINPARYDIKSGAPGKLVVFNDSYNGGWSLKTGGKAYSPLKVNGYANGFVLDGTLTDAAVVEYQPQRAYRLAALFSAVSFAGLVFAGLAGSKGSKRG